jgi:PAS domain S-box-containing protein/diguanylate cyclase (GGDEF)-like protein
MSAPTPRRGRLGDRALTWALGLAYLVVASLWIVVSDLLGPGGSVASERTYQTIKGLLFVAVNAVVLIALCLVAVRSRRSGQERLEALVRSSPVAIVAVDSDWRVIQWSPAAERLFGWSAQEVLGERLPIIPPGQAAESQRILEETRAGRPVEGLEVQRLHRDGSLLDLEIATAPLLDLSGGKGGGMALYLDLRPRRQAESRLRLQAAALEAAGSAIMVTDREGTILWVNPAFTRLTGFSAEEVVGRSPRLLRSGPADDTFRELWQAISEGSEYRGRLLNRRKDGSLYLADVTIAPVLGASGEPTHYVAVQEDVSETTRLADQLRFLASYDQLTGLPNRSLFVERIREQAERTLASEMVLVVAVGEVAQLRRVRQGLGPEAADLVVRQVGKRLQRAVEPTVEVAALGGGSFALAWAAPRDGDPGEILRACKEACEVPLGAQGQELHPRVAFGAALLPVHGPTVEDVLRAAEAALAWAVENDEPYRLFEDRLQSSLEDRLALEADLTRALREGELLVHYQPVVDLRSGQQALVEALLRWNHPRHGLLLPGRFLRLAEETGHVRRLDDWVLHRAAGDLGAGLRVSHGRVAVNLAAATLDGEELLTTLAELRSEGSVAAGEMVLEITERDAMRHPERTADVLREVRQLGFRVALDDFGVAYSSLNYLRNLPADYLKLDHSFVRGLGSVSRDERLVRMILSLAEDYGLEVIAEGVEEEFQLDWLRQHGCPYVQGFLLARPAPLADLLAGGDARGAGDRM